MSAERIVIIGMAAGTAIVALRITWSKILRPLFEWLYYITPKAKK